MPSLNLHLLSITGKMSPIFVNSHSGRILAHFCRAVVRDLVLPFLALQSLEMWLHLTPPTLCYPHYNGCWPNCAHIMCKRYVLLLSRSYIYIYKYICLRPARICTFLLIVLLLANYLTIALILNKQHFLQV